VKNFNRKLPKGFTLIELMIVVAILGILSVIAVPTYQDRVIRAQVTEGLILAEFAQQSIQAYYKKTHSFPADNAAAGLPGSGKIVGSYVTDVHVADGAVVITYGNRVNRFIDQKKLTLRPAIVEGYPVVPISWVCGSAAVPGKMKVKGKNVTNIPPSQLPIDCRM
jgi:type IV pilus assembly protein PilA